MEKKTVLPVLTFPPLVRRESKPGSASVTAVAYCGPGACARPDKTQAVGSARTTPVFTSHARVAAAKPSASPAVASTSAIVSNQSPTAIRP